MRVIVESTDVKVRLSVSDLQKVIRDVNIYGYTDYTLIGDIKEVLKYTKEDLEQTPEEKSKIVYSRFQDILKYQWCVTCDHDEELTDRIEKAQRLLGDLQSLGYNIYTGMVKK